jgi:hypothetical protein
MNCRDFNQLLLDAPDPATAGHRPEAAEHLRGCASCRKHLAFETQLHEGFAATTELAPPPELAQRILSIPARLATKAEPSFLETLLGDWKPFAFGFACLLGIAVSVPLLVRPAGTPRISSAPSPALELAKAPHREALKARPAPEIAQAPTSAIAPAEPARQADALTAAAAPAVQTPIPPVTVLALAPTVPTTPVTIQSVSSKAAKPIAPAVPPASSRASGDSASDRPGVPPPPIVAAKPAVSASKPLIMTSAKNYSKTVSQAAPTDAPAATLWRDSEAKRTTIGKAAPFTPSPSRFRDADKEMAGEKAKKEAPAATDLFGANQVMMMTDVSEAEAKAESDSEAEAAATFDSIAAVESVDGTRLTEAALATSGQPHQAAPAAGMIAIEERHANRIAAEPKADSAARDSRLLRLEVLARRHSEGLREGPLDLDDWQSVGRIAAAEKAALRPDAGTRWHLRRTAAGWVVFAAP